MRLVGAARPSGLPIDCPVQSSSRIILLLGQSNAGNHGETRYTASPTVFAFFEGNCYPAADPLPGATGGGGSIWSRLGDRLTNRWSSPLVLVPLAVDATAVWHWSEHPELKRRLAEALAALRLAGLKITDVFWMQGEADARRGTSSDQYLEQLRAVIGGLREQGVAATIWVSQTTRCRDAESAPIRVAQRAVVAPAARILAGPDTDSLGLEFRFDGCHFSDRGLNAAAELWAAVLRE